MAHAAEQTGLLGELNPAQADEYENYLKSSGTQYIRNAPTSKGIMIKALSPAEVQQQKSDQYTQQAISTLQEQKPVISNIYGQKRDVLQSQIDPTRARYDSLIADIKNQQKTSEEQQTLATSREFAKRGIAGGYVDQEMQNVLAPIRRDYAGLTQQTGLAQEADIKAIQDAIKLLYGEEAASNMSLAGLIASAQQGGATNALTSAGQLFNNAQSQASLAQQQAEAQANQNYQNAVLAMQQQLQPYNITSAQLSNEAAQLALDKARRVGSSPTTPQNIDALWLAYNKGIAGGQGINPSTGKVMISG